MERNEAIESLRQLYSETNAENKAALECLIPELAESKDEKIRKWLITQLENNYKGNYWAINAIAYLEKQKEQSFTHHEIDESLSDAVTHQMEDDGDVDDFVRKGIDDIALKYARLGAEWQKEQKSAEWSEGDEEMLEQAIKCVNNSGKLEVSTEEIEDWLKSLRSRPKSSDNWKPSKEQMEALNRCILIGNEDMIYALNSLCDDLKKLL